MYAFKKAAKIKGEGKPTLSMRRFPLSLCNHPKLMEFRAAPKNAVHFLYGAVLHRPGEHPWTPVRRFFFFATGGLGLWLEAFDKLGLFRCQSGIRGLWLTTFGKLGLFMCQSRSFRPTFWPPLQSGFAKDTAFLSAKAKSSRILQSRILG